MDALPETGKDTLCRHLIIRVGAISVLQYLVLYQDQCPNRMTVTLLFRY